MKKCKERKQRKTPTAGALRNMQDNLTQVTLQQGVNVIEVQEPIEVETPV